MINDNYVAKLSEGQCDDAKGRIIKAALEEFALLSLDGARTRQIAAKAGVNHAAISYYFGGKKELYLETIRQLTEYIHCFMADYFVRGKEIEKSKNPEEASKLILEFVMSRVCVDSEKHELLRHIILILTREEIYKTDAFDIIFQSIISPSVSLIEKQLFIASRGKIAGIDGTITAQMLLGQVLMINSAREGFKQITKWKQFGKSEYAKVESVFRAMLSKILS